MLYSVVDDAHGLHHRTLVGLKRLIELVRHNDGVDLSNANLEGVAMQWTNLENATLIGANTVEAEFAGAFFHNTVAEEGHIIEGPEYFD